MRQLKAWRLLLLILLGVAGWRVAPAAAQIGDLPQQVIESASISPDQTEAIRRYIEPRTRDLESGEPAKVKRAREDLESTANAQNATIGFRTAFSEALVPELTRLGRLENEAVVLAAIRIAGTLGTGPAVELADRYRADQRPAVRLMAVSSLAQTLRGLGRRAPILGPPEADHIVDNLAAGLAAEADPNVADTYIRALLAGSDVQAQRFEAAAAKSFSELARVTGLRLRKLGNSPVDREMLKALVRSAAAARDAILNDGMRRSLPEALVRESAGVGGDLLAYVLRQVRAGNLPVAAGPNQPAIDAARAQRQAEITVTRLGSALVTSSRDWLQRGGAPQALPDLAALLDQVNAKGDQEFIRTVVTIIGPGGVLTSDPFRYNPDRFLK